MTGPGCATNAPKTIKPRSICSNISESTTKLAIHFIVKLADNISRLEATTTLTKELTARRDLKRARYATNCLSTCGHIFKWFIRRFVNISVTFATRHLERNLDSIDTSSQCMKRCVVGLVTCVRKASERRRSYSGTAKFISSQRIKNRTRRKSRKIKKSLRTRRDECVVASVRKSSTLELL